MRLLIMIGVVYAMFVLGVTVMQRKLLYFPTLLTPDAAGQMAVREGFLPWRNQAGQIIGWQLAAAGTPVGSVLILHGNAGCALDRDYLAQPIHAAAPVDVFILEYPGYGARDGSPTQQSLLEAADDAFASLTNPAPIYLVSESIGTGIAAHLAGTHPGRVSGLALFAPYDDLAAVAQHKMPLLPARLVLKDRYQPARRLKDYHGPMAVVLAGADEVIPTKFGQRLYDGYAGPKTIQVIAGAHHNDIAEQSPEWWKRVFAFWAHHAGKSC